MDIRPPARRISARGLKVWRITGMIYSIITWIIVFGLLYAVRTFEVPKFWGMIAIIIAILITIISVYILPSIRWHRWRYEVREQEIELQYGVFIMKRTLVPMVRVQHVDTLQGPLLRKFKLATVAISTAATKHEIPAVDLQEAEELRHSISMLARVAEDDV